VPKFTEIEKNCGENECAMDRAIHSFTIGIGQLVLTQAGSMKFNVEYSDITGLLF
jgi:hypothetical protein